MNLESLRSATTTDADAIAYLVNQAYRPTVGTAGWTHETYLISGPRTNAHHVAELITRADSAVLIALNQSVIIACVHVAKEDDGCYIGMLAVNPAAQGAGVGKQLLAYAEEYAATYFATEKLFMVVLSRRSELIDFYVRRGYRRAGRVMKYPLSAGAGTPIEAGLTIEVLEKMAGI